MTTPTAGGASGTTDVTIASPNPTEKASSKSSSGGDARRGHDGTPPAAALTTVWKPPCPGGPISWDRSRTVPKVEAFSPCLPEGWVTTGYFSPAICPSGYVSVCERFDDAAQGPSVEAGETAALCGPPGFTCNAKDPVYAKSDAFDAPMIQIRWRSSDISVLQTHPLSPTSRATTAGGSSSATAGTAAATAAADGGGLPPGAIAAIIVGSMVAVALVVLAGLLVCRHRRARGGRGGRPSRGHPRLSTPGRQRRPANLHHPREAELPAGEVLLDDKKRPPFYSGGVAGDGAAAVAVAVTISHKRQQLPHQPHQAQQRQRRSIQELPGHEIPFEMGDCSPLPTRPPELAATVVDVQEAARGPCGLPREWGTLYSHDHAQHRVSDITPTATVESRASPVSTPAAVGGGELEELRARHARIEARRERLRELQLLDEEEGRVRTRLAEMQGDR
ncbi:hypothetical protein RB595_000498 [Gaeumannomyces hyphopodioides]